MHLPWIFAIFDFIFIKFISKMTFTQIFTSQGPIGPEILGEGANMPPPRAVDIKREAVWMRVKLFLKYYTRFLGMWHRRRL